MTPATGSFDRAAAARRAAVELIAERGLHSTSVAEVAKRAGVAAGTIYVHYPSKEALVAAAFVEAKDQMAEAAVAELDADAPPLERFVQMWRQMHAHLAGDPAVARFVLQLEVLPMSIPADTGSVLYEAALAPDMVDHYVDLPLLVLWELGMGPAIRAAATPLDPPLDDDALQRIARACWRAITTTP
jgi:TetR/AcrR family transcriptional regulator, multidrug resistance operon repressor